MRNFWNEKKNVIYDGKVFLVLSLELRVQFGRSWKPQDIIDFCMYTHIGRKVCGWSGVFSSLCVWREIKVGIDSCVIYSLVVGSRSSRQKDDDFPKLFIYEENWNLFTHPTCHGLFHPPLSFVFALMLKKIAEKKS